MAVIRPAWRIIRPAIIPTSNRIKYATPKIVSGVSSTSEQDVYVHQGHHFWPLTRIQLSFLLIIRVCFPLFFPSVLLFSFIIRTSVDTPLHDSNHRTCSSNERVFPIRTRFPNVFRFECFYFSDKTFDTLLQQQKKKWTHQPLRLMRWMRVVVARARGKLMSLT